MICLLRKTRKSLRLIVIICGIIFFCIWQNNSIVVTKFDYFNSKIPKEFNGFKIVQISDLHNKEFGKKQLGLLNKIKSISPDIIVITGDLIDRRKYNLDIAMTFVYGAVKIAPVYYVSGNHEALSGKYSLLKESLSEADVYILDNIKLEITKKDSSICIFGISDPDFLTSDYMEEADDSIVKKQLNQWSEEKGFKVLLSHRPELFELYCENKMDLIFTGHAHGGQFRLPFIGGIFAPDQGFFPKYTSNSYSKNSSTMFVSRGLGNSIFPIRLFNRPEIVVVTLKNE